ncbi:hypothetical protein HAX54_033960 [Datura stramonium]|uniref:Uncharacterized protein n=1 Tax=Datura stramonium TaxID=4076 RepID=A0ABS8SDT4_DATST|nr:hypothetical protein [Datura stramonium]
MSTRFPNEVESSSWGLNDPDGDVQSMMDRAHTSNLGLFSNKPILNFLYFRMKMCTRMVEVEAAMKLELMEVDPNMNTKVVGEVVIVGKPEPDRVGYKVS